MHYFFFLLDGDEKFNGNLRLLFLDFVFLLVAAFAACAASAPADRPANV